VQKPKTDFAAAGFWRRTQDVFPQNRKHDFPQNYISLKAFSQYITDCISFFTSSRCFSPPMRGTPMIPSHSPSHYLTTAQAAEILCLSARTLERMRIDGSGPPFLKAGGGKRSRVLYMLADIDAWLAGHRFGSTSEYGR
jgi:hypothetical protein